MRYPRLLFSLGALALLLAVLPPVQAQTKRASGYHSRSVAARSRPVARVANRRRYSDEDRQRLAPGMRISMPTPPSTDYMGRPLKPKTPRPASVNSTVSAEKAAPAPPAKGRKKK